MIAVSQFVQRDLFKKQIRIESRYRFTKQCLVFEDADLADKLACRQVSIYPVKGVFRYGVDPFAVLIPLYRFLRIYEMQSVSSAVGSRVLVCQYGNPICREIFKQKVGNVWLF